MVTRFAFKGIAGKRAIDLIHPRSTIPKRSDPVRYQSYVDKSFKSRVVSLMLLVTFVVAIIATNVAKAEVPSTVSYQGRLTTSTGVPVDDGTYSIAFRIYDDSTGGNLFWEEVKSVSIVGGLFSVQLGETNPLNQNTLAIPNLFLALQIGAGPESSPRTRLNVVPYATLVGTVEGASGGMIIGDLTSTGQVSGSSSFGPGGYFQSYLTAPGSRYGLVGKYMGSEPLNGSGVYGYSRPMDGWGNGGEFEGGRNGVFGYVIPTDNTGGIYSGLRGLASSNTPQQDAMLYGVYGSASNGVDNYGVLGTADGSATSASCKFYGLSGFALGSGQYAVNYGVYALAQDAPENIGLYAKGSTVAGIFDGDVNVYGALHKAGGSFKIDHPLDPANKYLQHSFVESPDMMNIYNGNVTLDADGKATVMMPEWFDALNRDFRYQLTAIGAPGPNLYIAQKMTNNQFSIAGGSGGMEVSWQVTGVRHDAWAEAHRIQVEVPKDPGQVGTYLHPELFGMPESMGETYEMTKQAEEMAKQAEQDRERITAKKPTEAPKK
jgi:hypothetical protein